jgi:mannitol-specific phosphotransferase system IIBC component
VCVLCIARERERERETDRQRQREVVIHVHQMKGIKKKVVRERLLKGKEGFLVSSCSSSLGQGCMGDQVLRKQIKQTTSVKLHGKRKSSARVTAVSNHIYQREIKRKALPGIHKLGGRNDYGWRAVRIANVGWGE